MEQRKLNTGLLIVAYALIAIMIGTSIFSLTRVSRGEFVTVIVDIFAGICAFIYFFKGYTKDAAKYFKIVMILTAASFLVDYLGLAFAPTMAEVTPRDHYFEIVSSLVIYGNYMVLAFAKDLGEKESNVMVGVNCVIYVINLIMMICSSDRIELVIQCVSWLASALICFAMVRAKYLDKRSRNRT